MTDTSMTTAQTSGSNTLSAFFDERSDAVDAMERLRALGIPDSALRMTEGSERDRDVVEPAPTKGFFESLGDLFFPDEDRHAYAEGLARGGFLVTVTGLSTALYDQALDILDDEGAVDIDERQESWRAEGWSGPSSSGQTSSGQSASGGYASGMTAGAAAGSAAGIYAGTGTTPEADTDLRRSDEGMTGERPRSVRLSPLGHRSGNRLQPRRRHRRCGLAGHQRHRFRSKLRRRRRHGHRTQRHLRRVRPRRYG